MKQVTIGNRSFSKVLCGTNAFWGHSHFTVARSTEYRRYLAKPIVKRGVHNHIMIKFMALVFAASTLLLAGCSKSSQITKAGDTASLIDWGIVEFSANTPKHLSLGEGKDCTVTAISLAGGNLEIKIETKEKLARAEMPPGVPAGTPMMSTKTQTMRVPSNVELIVSVGHRPVRFTPKFTAQ